MTRPAAPVGRRRPKLQRHGGRKPDYHSPPLENFVQMVIPSDLAAGRKAQQQILDQLAGKGFCPDSLFAVQVALDEALTNAIKHGNRLDPQKKVRINTRISPEQAEIVIEDEGPGFARDDIPDPTCGENLEKPCGRGLLLMESVMNHVEYSRGGRCVRMIRRNEPRVAARPPSAGDA
jgi:serine/threonine-protein kinase RsbW